MKIERININDITPYENNAKEHPEWQIDQIVKSIEKFGFNDPIAIDENGVIIEGHGRYYACDKLGYSEVECIRLEHLTEEQKRAYILAHNKLTMNTGFDIETLELELSEIPFDMSDFGFADIDLPVEHTNTASEHDEKYTRNINDIYYEPSDVTPAISECISTERYDSFVSKINSLSGITEEERRLLKLSATRFIEYRYDKIADLYASSEGALRETMQELALVIVDFEESIRQGITRIKDFAIDVIREGTNE